MKFYNDDDYKRAAEETFTAEELEEYRALFEAEKANNDFIADMFGRTEEGFYIWLIQFYDDPEETEEEI